MSGALTWARERADWPHADCSRFVRAAGLRWHVQQMGIDAPSAPSILLIHGTGASTHSWRDMLPGLARAFAVTAVDLPGHGFTQRPASRGLSLASMTEGLAALLDELAIAPKIVVGHSAGAAILARLCVDGVIAPQCLISLNGALLPFRGLAGKTFPRVAQMLFLNPLVPRVFALAAGRRARVDRLIRNTGSTLDDRGIDLYTRLFASSSHVGAALGMMAAWNLDGLVDAFGKRDIDLCLVVGSADRAVPPSEARHVADRIAGAQVVTLDGLGHLAHEEDPDRVVALIEDIAADSSRSDTAA